MIFHAFIAYIAPDKWNKAQVNQWINDVCEECEIEEDDVSMLKTLSGSGLAHLTRQDFKERCPKQGDLIFTLWKKLLNKSTEEPGSDSAKSPPNSPRKGKQYTNCYKCFLYFIRETGGRNQSEVYWFGWYVDNHFTGSLLYECELVCSLRTILQDQLFERIFQFQHTTLRLKREKLHSSSGFDSLDQLL